VDGNEIFRNNSIISVLYPGYPTDTTTNPNNYVAKVSGSTSGPVIGPGIVLKVMAGDQFSIRVSDWYQLNVSHRLSHLAYSKFAE
jgi:hypothetical protein